MSSRVRGQGIVEYLLAMTVILIGLLLAARPDGALQSAIRTMLEKTQGGITNSVKTAECQFNKASGCPSQ